jgi:hypothetical protein
MVFSVMGVTNSFQKLSQLIQRYESDGGSLKRVEAETTDTQNEIGMSVTLDVPVSLCSGDGTEASPTPTAATITEDGGLQVEFSGSVFPNLDEYVSDDAIVDPEAVQITEDGTIVTSSTVAFGAETGAEDDKPVSAKSDSQERSPAVTTEDGTQSIDSSEPTSESDTSADPAGETTSVTHHDLLAASNEETEDDHSGTERELAATRNEDLPPYDDTEYLQCLYDSFDTFTEMAEEIEMDVASETVRRYMTEAGVHEPSSYNTADEADENGEDVDDSQAVAEDASDDESVAEDLSTEQESDVEPEDPIESVSNKPLVADGIGLPGDLDIEELADALETSMTLHGVQRELGLSRERTREVLDELNLIDLVMGRISDNPDQEVSRAEIADRIRSSVSTAC